MSYSIIRYMKMAKRFTSKELNIYMISGSPGMKFHSYRFEVNFQIRSFMQVLIVTELQDIKIYIKSIYCKQLKNLK